MNADQIETLHILNIYLPLILYADLQKANRLKVGFFIGVKSFLNFSPLAGHS